MWMKFTMSKDRNWTTATWLTVVLPIMMTEWILFKCCYPYADFFTDSSTYIRAAAHHDAMSFRPIGYSLFLRLVHTFSHSDTVVVTLQYFLVQGASLGLVVSLRRWCGLRDGTMGVLMGFILLNPVLPYVCNYISSDALFIALSLIWLTVLMGLLRDPGWWRLGGQVVLLFVIFQLRYVALFYPAVAALTILLARKGWAFSLVGVGASIGIVLAGTLWIREITKRETGADLFSAFSGWQIANNVLNIYPRIPVDTTGLPSAECQELARMVRDYFRGQMPKVESASGKMSLRREDEIEAGAAETTKDPAVTTAYMWQRSSPLYYYLQVYRQRHRLTYFDAWNQVAVIYTQYGNYVVRKHPKAYAYYYVWPSAKSFFFSDLDVFRVYNEGKRDVDVVAKNWFDYPSQRTRVCSATIQAKLLAPMPWIYLLLNGAFAVAACLFLPFASRRARDPVFTGCFRLASAFLLANAFFSIFASPSVFRYQVLPMMVLFVFMVCGISKSRLFSLN